MTTTYQRPVPRWSIDERTVTEVLAEGPTYVRSRTATRWHRVRSAIRELREWDYPNVHEVFHHWCGTSSFGGRALLTDEPPADEYRCGTCEGRAAGAARVDMLRFDPSTAVLPSRCPGSRSDTLYANVGTQYRVFLCLACGERVGGRYAGGPYSGRWGLVNHAPGPGLVAPCPLHGWLRLVVADGKAACACGTGS